ncbi:MAG: hypothetical protein Q9169_003333 [Polycauliona sp. 2 TL-2023]
MADQLIKGYLQRREARRQTDSWNARALLRGPDNHTGTDIENEDRREAALNRAQVICVKGTMAHLARSHGPAHPLPPGDLADQSPSGPQGLDIKSVFRSLVIGLHPLVPLSSENLVNQEISNDLSHYVAMLRTSDLNYTVPDRMYVEVLTKAIRSEVSQGRLKFLVRGFPDNETQAAVFEEDCSLIRAFIQVEGAKPPQTPQDVWDKDLAALQPVFDKLDAEGRAFKVSGRPPGQINLYQDPRGFRSDMDALVATLQSTAFIARVLVANDVFRPGPPPGYPGQPL